MSKHVRLVAVAEALQAAVASSVPSAPVYGYHRSEGVIQILSADNAGPGLSVIGAIKTDDTFSERDIDIPVDDRVVRVELGRDLPIPSEIEVVRLRDGSDARRVGLANGLDSTRVVLAGAGSLGSQIGLLLSEAGVGRFDIIDRDRLGAENLSRHACDVLDLGREKAAAVADLVERRGSKAWARSVDLSALGDEQLGKIVDGASLVLATTDSPAAQFVLNEACLVHYVPMVAVGCFERACGGEIVVIRPGGRPCLYCAVGFRAQLAGTLALQERRQAYQASDANRLEAEPGLAADIGYIASMAAAYALALLEPSGSRADLLLPEHRFALLHGGSRPRDAYADLFGQPFDLVYAQVKRNEACPVCGFTTESA